MTLENWPQKQMEMETETPGPRWYSKFFEYLRNRNRIGPGKVELPDCDFFIVGPRRTLRILRPALKSGRFYETSGHDRPESVNDNFFSRWTRRPHPSGNCRCSFRQSSRLSTTEEQFISAEINRIRTSLCEAEKTGEDIEEIEKRVSLTLESLRITSEESKIRDDRILEGSAEEAEETKIDEVEVKDKIVKDLERYINGLLEEIMSDTMKSISGAGNPPQRKWRSTGSAADEIMGKSTEECRHSETSSPEVETFKISFAFPGEKIETAVFKSPSHAYVNPAFEGTVQEPDALNFYLRRQLGPEIILEQLDCVDSGINSVETFELQPEEEPSLEESLLEIIDAKLGRTPFSKSWENLDESEKMRDEKKGEKENDSQVSKNVILEEGEEDKESNAKRSIQTKKTETLDKSTNTFDMVDSNLEDFRELEDVLDDQSFERLRLEFKESTSTPKVKTRTVSALREKLMARLSSSKKSRECEWKKTESLKLGKSQNRPLELEDYRRKWPEIEGSSLTSYQDPNEFVVFRRNRKPMIVFLHGFGSCADIFEHQLNYFSSLGYPCIAPEMLGHGMSSAPNRSRDYNFEKILKDLDLILHHYAFKPGQKCILVGHNYGCSFATALACKYESSIHQLVLISGGGPTPLAPPSSETAGHCCLRATLTPFLVCGLHRDILYSARGRQHPYCGSEPEEQWPSHMQHVLNGMVWPEGDYVFHRRICTPTLLIHGLRDNKVSLVQECQMERTMMKAFLEAMPAAGHVPMTDCPNQLNHMIHCFIDLWKNKKW